MKQHLCLYLLNSRHTLEDLCTVRAVGLCLTAGMSGADAHSFDAWCSLRQYQHLEIAFALAANVSLYTMECTCAQSMNMLLYNNNTYHMLLIPLLRLTSEPSLWFFDKLSILVSCQ